MVRLLVQLQRAMACCSRTLSHCYIVCYIVESTPIPPAISIISRTCGWVYRRRPTISSTVVQPQLLAVWLSIWCTIVCILASSRRSKWLMFDVVQSPPPPTNPRVPQLVSARFGFARLTKEKKMHCPPPLVAAWKCCSKCWLYTGDWGFVKKKEKKWYVFDHVSGGKAWFLRIGLEGDVPWGHTVHIFAQQEWVPTLLARFALDFFCFYEAFSSIYLLSIYIYILCAEIWTTSFLSVAPSALTCQRWTLSRCWRGVKSTRA